MLKLTDEVLDQSKTVYENPMSGEQSDHVYFYSILGKIVNAWDVYALNIGTTYQAIDGGILDAHIDRNGGGFRWHHGIGYDIFGDLFTTNCITNGPDSISLVNRWLISYDKFLNGKLSDDDLQFNHWAKNKHLNCRLNIHDFLAQNE